MENRDLGAGEIPITLYFGGEIPNNGLDADEVSSVADGLSRLASFVAKFDDSHGRDFTLRLKTIRAGSSALDFVLELTAVAQSVLGPVLSSGFDIRKLGEILSDIMKLREFLRGKPPQSIEINSAGPSVNIVNSAGAQITINQHIHDASNNFYVSESITKIAKPLKKPKRSLDLIENKKILHKISSDEYGVVTVTPSSEDSFIDQQVVEATLRVRKANLADTHSWEFAWGSNRIRASISDDVFMAKVLSGDQEFRAGDELRVKLRIEEHRKGKNITTKHFIDEVLSHKQGEPFSKLPRAMNDR